MFGYIKICKPELKIKEFAEYKGVYCSVCKHMGKAFGKITRFTLSYDCAFLAMLAMSIKEDEDVKFCTSRCPLNPLKKCSFCKNYKSEIDFASSISMLLTYYKLKDDVDDSNFLKKGLAFALLALFKKPYSQAKKKFNSIDELICEQMQRQKQIEKEPDASIDICAEPTAIMLSHIAQMLSLNEKQKFVLKEFGYFLGRWVYLIDAADDIDRDRKHNNFNPFFKNNLAGTKLNQEMGFALNQTLGRLIAAYNLLDIYKFKSVLDNIIYYGLQETQQKVLNKEKSDICE